MAYGTHQGISKEMRDCIKDSQQCEALCMETVNHCLELGGKHADPSLIRSLMDCAEICQTNADYLLRQSEQYQSVCQTCAEVCDQCEKACRQFGDDTMMRSCAEVCHRTAQSCRQVAGIGMRKAA